MPFVIILFTPLIFACSIYRLLSIPMQIKNATIALKNPLSMASRLLAIAAYVLLWGASLAFCYGLYMSLTSNSQDIKAILKFAAYYECYPAFYVLAEWRFYHVFKRPQKVPYAAQKQTLAGSIAQSV